MLAYDENWNPVSMPLAGATIIIDGKESAYTTDSNGKVKFRISEPGKYNISASCKDKLIVAPTAKLAVRHLKGTCFTVDDVDYAVVKQGALKGNKVGKVSVARAGKNAVIPSKVKFGGIKYKVVNK